MRRLLSTVIFLMWASTVMGQLTDLIFLKSEEVVRGTITDTTSSAGVSILVLPDSVMKVYPHADILRIIYKKKRKDPRASGKSRDAYLGMLRLGYTWEKGSNAETNGFLRFDFINAVAIEDVASVGLGVGARVGQNDVLMVPVYLDFRVAPLKRRVSPMLAISGGLSFQADRNWEYGGMYFSPEIGIRVGSMSNSHFLFSIGAERFSYTQVTTGNFFFNRVHKIEYWGWTASISIGF